MDAVLVALMSLTLAAVGASTWRLLARIDATKARIDATAKDLGGPHRRHRQGPGGAASTPPPRTGGARCRSRRAEFHDREVDPLVGGQTPGVSWRSRP